MVVIYIIYHYNIGVMLSFWQNWESVTEAKIILWSGTWLQLERRWTGGASSFHSLTILPLRVFPSMTFYDFKYSRTSSVAAGLQGSWKKWQCLKKGRFNSLQTCWQFCINSWMILNAASACFCQGSILSTLMAAMITTPLPLTERLVL